MWREFKAFIMRGNVIDLAVAVIIGASFGAVVKSLVDDVLMPVIGLATGGIDFTNKFVLLKSGVTNPGPYPTIAAAKAAGAVTLNYGALVNAIVTFLIVAFAVFMIVKAVNKVYKRPVEAKPNTKNCPFCAMSIPLAATRCPECTSQLSGAAA